MSENPEVMEFLLTRRSRPAKMLRQPVPDSAQLTRLLGAAARVPDHGKLEPWRFVVLERPALARLSGRILARGAELGIDAEKTAKAAATFADSPMIVAVVASPKPSDKIPEIEQTLSVGAVCLGLVNAALASGWGANWLTGWVASDREILTELGLSPQEWVAGFIHLGTAQGTPPERPRPDIATLTTWIAQ
ncbi:nitroreductase [Roseinatronobacter sp.]|uniref:nitroreductase family protein n=1 Tax=Roseinatronobacter sp. TaxID=1945755 RepID=UPI0025D67B11|nr:nitroreductase [Rhodobaca sp.]